MRRVPGLSDLVLTVPAKDGTEGVGDLPHGGLGLDHGDDGAHEVAAIVGDDAKEKNEVSLFSRAEVFSYRFLGLILDPQAGRRSLEPHRVWWKVAVFHWVCMLPPPKCHVTNVLGVIHLSHRTPS